MSPTPPVLETALDDLPLHRRGKVRDMYEVDQHLLMVATDRISAFDVVLGSGIPDKGRVLTQLSAFWFERTRDLVPNHMLSTRTSDFPETARRHQTVLEGRAMLVRRTTPLPVECVARGYLSGSAWKEYQDTGRVCGVALPSGLAESDRLPEPIFTPATKADTGHDLNITEREAAAIVGTERIGRLRDLTLALYQHGAAHAESRGIIVADTKFEFGVVTRNGVEEILLIDEILTPDSSRFWPSDAYRPGGAQPSFDKQYVRDYLEDVRWNKQPPGPELPSEVVARTRAKYLEAFERLTGRPLDGLTRG